jgi:hypothetical protein
MVRVFKLCEAVSDTVCLILVHSHMLVLLRPTNSSAPGAQGCCTCQRAAYAAVISAIHNDDCHRGVYHFKLQSASFRKHHATCTTAYSSALAPLATCLRCSLHCGTRARICTACCSTVALFALARVENVLPCTCHERRRGMHKTSRAIARRTLSVICMSTNCSSSSQKTMAVIDDCAATLGPATVTHNIWHACRRTAGLPRWLRIQV